jgi:glutamyl-Q tRNA(Asp) synthetase
VRALASPTRAYIGRFAPSPTGPLHFGSLVAALASYVDAKAHDGTWLVRIEDVDTARSSREYETTILEQLYAYGFAHDGVVLRQRERTERYREIVEHLHSRDLVYRCRCSRKNLADARRNRENEIIYPGTCRAASVDWNTREASAVRIKIDAVPHVGIVAFDDRVYGRIEQHVAEDVGDFVLHRADGDFAYQLAVVVDDADQNVTHVVRGADLLLNTPRQILLQRMLGFVTPSYLHVPIAKNANGEKLSKQTLAEALPMERAAQVQTLRQAWTFLQQQAIAEVQSPAEFLGAAVAAWRPSQLCESATQGGSRTQTYN